MEIKNSKNRTEQEIFHIRPYKSEWEKRCEKKKKEFVPRKCVSNKKAFLSSTCWIFLRVFSHKFSFSLTHSLTSAQTTKQFQPKVIRASEKKNIFVFSFDVIRERENVWSPPSYHLGMVRGVMEDTKRKKHIYSWIYT